MRASIPIAGAPRSFTRFDHRVVVRRSGHAIAARLAPRPRARAASKPARVRSRISARSNSASAPKMWNTSLPALESVSIASFKLRSPTPCVRSDLGVRDEVLERPPQPVEAPHHQRVAGPPDQGGGTRAAGRSAAPPAVSSKMRSHPAARRTGAPARVPDGAATARRSPISGSVSTG